MQSGRLSSSDSFSGVGDLEGTVFDCSCLGLSFSCVAANAATSMLEILTLVSSTNARISSDCVALLVLNGKPRVPESFCLSTLLSYSANNVCRFVLPVARIKSNLAELISCFLIVSSCRTSEVSAASLYLPREEPAECAAPHAASETDYAPPCLRPASASARSCSDGMSCGQGRQPASHSFPNLAL
jgi:hypothetical protein